MLVPPSVRPVCPIVVSSYSALGPIRELRGPLRASAAASTALGTTNLAVAVPVYIPEPATFLMAFWINGATASGTIELGVYDAAWVRLYTTTPVTQAGADGTAQVVTLGSAWTLGEGLHYLAISGSSATGTFRAIPVLNQFPKVVGMAEMASAHNPLPTTFTPATTILHLPAFGISQRDFI